MTTPEFHTEIFIVSEGESYIVYPRGNATALRLGDRIWLAQTVEFFQPQCAGYYKIIKKLAPSGSMKFALERINESKMDISKY